MIKDVFKALTGTTAAYVVIIVLSIPIIYLFGFREMRFFLVPSSSMEPTLYRNDYLVSLNADGYHRGDVIVLRDPQDNKSYLVKRLIAVGGDTVSVIGGAVFVNGQYLSEPYVLSPPNYQMDSLQVPEGHIFVLGDNRNNSDDSHEWPEKTVEKSSIVGRVVFIYYPYAHAGKMEGYYHATAKAPDAI